ncbi:MAG: SHOCT domain-containing protein [Acidobacteria bacterium]|nr:SHOCT domain-containing protein [Acidobacteriota bacterium]
MSISAGVLVHPATKERVEIFRGFSWPCLFAGCFWYAKGMWGMGILAFLLAFVTFGLSWLVFPFIANDQYRRTLLNEGYVPEDQADHLGVISVQGSVADEIRKLAELKASGVLTEEEFAHQKSRLLGS